MKTKTLIPKKLSSPPLAGFPKAPTFCFYLLSCFFAFCLCPLFLLAQWTQQSSGTDLDLKSICFTDNENGWAVGSEGIILHTADGGDNWIEQPSGTDFPLQSVYFINPDKGWIAGGGTAIILRTINGGETWEEMYIDTSFYFHDVYFPDSLNGWAVGQVHGGFMNPGLLGILLHSIDGGETWVRQDSLPTPNIFPIVLPLRGVHFIDPDNGWVVGGSIVPSSGYTYCIIMNTNDGGITWDYQFEHISPPFSGDEYWLNSVYFTDTLNGWAAGGHRSLGHKRIIQKTTDGGNNWDMPYFKNSPILHSIYFADSIKGWAVGGSGTIMHTSNGGDTWEEQSSGTINWLFGVCFTDSDNGWIVGDTGTILHTDNGGVVQIPNYQKPNSKIHLQNYPNPFSASTTIEYELTQAGKTEIQIYNQAGQLIKEVEQGEGRIGKNYYTLQTNNLPSGIYLIRMQIGNEIITKKIIKL